MTTTISEERIDIMTDYQMRTVVNMMIMMANDTLKSHPEKQELLEKMIAVRDGKIDELTILSGKKAD